MIMTIEELLDKVQAGEGQKEELYLYDCSIPKKLPGLLEHLRIPRYFAHDYLMQSMHKHTWSTSWPSLFVGAAGTASSLHVDMWHSHFWMVMVKGRKRWTLFHPDDTHLLAPEWASDALAHPAAV